MFEQVRNLLSAYKPLTADDIAKLQKEAQNSPEVKEARRERQRAETFLQALKGASRA